MQNQFSQSLLFEQNDILAYIDAKSDQERQTRFSVYRNNVFSSLIDVLGEIYPICKMVVGDEFFAALAYQYVRKTPPSSPVLSEYGHQFSKFSSQIPQLASIPYFCELSKLEYQLLQLTHKRERPTLTPEDIQQQIMQLQDPTQTQWQLTDNCILWRTTYAIGSIYMAHQPNTACRLAEINWQEPEYLLLTKKGLYGHCYLIPEEEWHLLSQFKLGQSFAQSCAHFDEHQLTQLFTTIIQKPIIQSIRPL